MTNETETVHADAPEAPETGDWRAALPDDLRAHPALEAFAGVDALAREHVNLQKLIGRKGVLPPGPDADEDERARYLDALGRPESPDGYDLSDIDRPDGLPWNDADEAHMLARMHAAGLTNEQARALFADYLALQGAAWSDAQDAQARAVDAARDELRESWGGAFDARIDLANRAFAAAFGEDLDDARRMRLADGTLLGDHPAVVRAFAVLGEQMTEADLVGGKSPGLSPSAEEARARLASLESGADTRAALLDRAHPDHRRVVSERSALARIAFDGDAAA